MRPDTPLKITVFSDLQFVEVVFSQLAAVWSTDGGKKACRMLLGVSGHGNDRCFG